MTVHYCNMTVNYCGILTLEMIGFFTMVNYRGIFITFVSRFLTFVFLSKKSERNNRSPFVQLKFTFGFSFPKDPY
jgi:hypothetical protein